jgi:hypothetical protein
MFYILDKVSTVCRLAIDRNARAWPCDYAYRVWRPTKIVVDDALALCDPATVARSDLMATARVSSNFTGEIYYQKYNQQQRFYYMSKQKPDELVLFITFDSEDCSKSECSHYYIYGWICSVSDSSCTSCIFQRQRLELAFGRRPSGKHWFQGYCHDEEGLKLGDCLICNGSFWKDLEFSYWLQALYILPNNAYIIKIMQRKILLCEIKEQLLTCLIYFVTVGLAAMEFTN